MTARMARILMGGIFVGGIWCARFACGDELKLTPTTSPAVAATREAAAVGDWIAKIRPHATNRSHTIMRKLA